MSSQSLATRNLPLDTPRTFWDQQQKDHTVSISIASYFVFISLYQHGLYLCLWLHCCGQAGQSFL